MSRVPASPSKQVGGRLADTLTLTRAILTPLIMAVIVWGWGLSIKTNGQMVTESGLLPASILATALFLIAGLTDIADDLFGGAKDGGYRKYGWFDDIADTILVTGTLIALIIGTYLSGTLSFVLAAAAGAIIARNILIAIFKGYDFSRRGWPQTTLGTLKNGLAMLATLLLVAAPWLTTMIDNWRAGRGNAEAVYGSASNYVWNAGLFLLIVTAILSLITMFVLMADREDRALPPVTGT